MYGGRVVFGRGGSERRRRGVGGREGGRWGGLRLGGLVWGVVLGGLVGGVPMVWPSGVWMVGSEGGG